VRHKTAVCVSTHKHTNTHKTHNQFTHTALQITFTHKQSICTVCSLYVAVSLWLLYIMPLHS